MSVRSACIAGCCVTLAIVALLVAINGFLRYDASKSDADLTAEFNVRGDCTLLDISYRVAQPSSGSHCNTWQYLLSVRVSSRGDSGRGGSRTTAVTRVAYGNFFPDACGGVRFNTSQVGQSVPCWLRTTADDYVRVSPVYTPDKSQQRLAIGCVAVAAFIFSAFCAYNVLLWLGVCLHIGPFAPAAVEQRAQAARDAEAAAAAAHDTDPFGEEGGEIKVADRSWLHDMAFNNAYARAVLRRFGGGGAGNGAAAQETAPTDHAHTAEDGDADVQVAAESRRRRVRGGSTAGTGGGVAIEMEPVDMEEVASSDPPGTASDAANPLSVTSPQQPQQQSQQTAEDDQDDVVAMECCVCWEPLGPVAFVFPCFHLTCTACAGRLVSSARRRDFLVPCPMCRRQCFPGEMRRLVRGDDVGASGAADGHDGHGDAADEDRAAATTADESISATAAMDTTNNGAGGGTADGEEAEGVDPIATPVGASS